jgi:hypothetical protein
MDDRKNRMEMREISLQTEMLRRRHNIVSPYTLSFHLCSWVEGGVLAHTT